MSKVLNRWWREPKFQNSKGAYWKLSSCGILIWQKELICRDICLAYQVVQYVYVMQQSGKALRSEQKSVWNKSPLITVNGRFENGIFMLHVAWQSFCEILHFILDSSKLLYNVEFRWLPKQYEPSDRTIQLVYSIEWILTRVACVEVLVALGTKVSVCKELGPSISPCIYHPYGKDSTSLWAPSCTYEILMWESLMTSWNIATSDS